MFKTLTTLNDGQQQPVDNFAPRADLKRFFEDGAIHLALVRKRSASRYFAKHMRKSVFCEVHAKRHVATLTARLPNIILMSKNIFFRILRYLAIS
jgi:hypothetical protein